MIEVGQLVECELAVAFRISDQMSFRPTVWSQILQLFHACITRCRLIAISDATAAGDLLKASVNHAAPESLFEALVEVPNLPEFFLDPTALDSILKLPQRRDGEILLLQGIECCFSG